MLWLGQSATREYYKPDLLMILIGGHFVTSPADAAFATKNCIKPKFAIPIHYATNPMLKGTPAEYIKALGQAPTKVMSMNPGDSVQF